MVLADQDVRQIDGGDGLADAALVVHDRDSSHYGAFLSSAVRRSAK